MANDNQASRTFLAIVLGGIVLALVIAAYFMYGNKGDTNVKVQLPPSEEQPAETATRGDASFRRGAFRRGSCCRRRGTHRGTLGASCRGIDASGRTARRSACAPELAALVNLSR